jgi:hypothetical protein
MGPDTFFAFSVSGPFYWQIQHSMTISSTIEGPDKAGTKRLVLSSVVTRVAGGLLAWLTVIYILSFVSLVLGQGIWDYSAIIALVAIPVWIFLVHKRDEGGGWWVNFNAVLLAAAIIATGFWFSKQYVDQSWDSTAYHQEAILQMVDGWPEFPEKLPSSIPYDTKIDTYPKAVWVISASIYSATSNLEGAKLLHVVLFACAFLFLFGALLRTPGISSWGALLVAAAAALNPVVIYQSLSFYVDGQLSSLITAFLGLVLLMSTGVRRHHLLLLAALIVLLINIKQTGVVYAAILTMGLLVVMYIYQREWFKRTLTAALISGLLGVGVFGYSPYVTNTINHGNPVYPILGREDVDFEAGHRPPGFNEMNGVNRLARSTFSEPTVAKDAPSVLRIPFTMSQDKYTSKFWGADIRLGGWGVLFSGALALSLPGLLLLFFVPGKPRTVGLVLLFTVAVSVLVNPEAWWARFAPQWYLVGLIPAALLLFGTRLPVRVFGLVIVFVLLINSSLVAYTFYPFNKELTAKHHEYLQLIVDLNLPITVYFGAFPSNRIRLQEAGISYQAVESASELGCEDPHTIFAHEGLFCVYGER